jgi:hypothetical protein
MNCEKVQSLFDDAAHGRLDEALARQLRQHLADCTDCRVQQQRAARLQRLLALKRYEQPPPGYYDNVVAEFHQRLAAETPPAGRWARLAAWACAPVGPPSRGGPFLSEPPLAWLGSPRLLAWAGACALAVVAGSSWFARQGASRPDVIAEALRQPEPVAVVPVDSAFATRLALAPSHPIIPSPAATPAVSPDPLVELVAAGPPQPSPPRYVLDRIAMTPVSYEMASANF